MRPHRAFLEILALGAVIRYAVTLVRAPAVYQDSLVYIKLSKGSVLQFTALRPTGYSWLIRVISLGGGDLKRVIMVQHATGLMVGVLVYGLLVRLGVRTWSAVVAVALITLDAYSVAMGQSVLTEPFFTLALFTSIFLVVATERRPAHLAASGFMLASAALIRPAALFAIPVWLAYVIVLRKGWRIVALSTGAVLLPLLVYCSIRGYQGRTFALTDSDGWFLYSRVAPSVDCRGADIPPETRPLCSGPKGQTPDFYLFDRTSPAQVLFFGTTGDVNVDEQVDRDNNLQLRKFAMAVIRAHPATYARTVSEDFIRYLQPSDPAPELTLYGDPQSLMIRYERLFHIPWWLLPSTAITVVLAFLMNRRWPVHGREILFLAGMGFGILLGTTTTTAFHFRYAVPLFPIFVCTLALSVRALAGTEPRPSTHPPEPTPSTATRPLASP